MALEHEVILDLEKIPTSFVLVFLRVSTIRATKIVRSIIFPYKLIELWRNQLDIFGIKKAHGLLDSLDPL